MTFIFKQATREAAKMLIGLCGPSGSGKTLSALKLATGLGGQISYVDTEQGRALQYAGDYRFMHCVLPPPFSPQRYGEIVEAAIGTRAGVVIIDSMSHVWEGPGGILEQVDEARKKSDDRNAFSVWAGPKQAHQRLVNRLLQIPAHVIICFRAKEKKGLAPGQRGKMEVVDLGWHPICEQGMVYELTINCLLSADKKGTPIIDGFDFGKLPYNMAHLLPTNRQISEETGRAIAQWCRDGGLPTLSSARLDAIEQNADAAGIPPPASSAAAPGAASSAPPNGGQPPAGTRHPVFDRTSIYLINPADNAPEETFPKSKDGAWKWYQALTNQLKAIETELPILEAWVTAHAEDARRLATAGEKDDAKLSGAIRALFDHYEGVVADARQAGLPLGA